jgi:hypothetical protein
VSNARAEASRKNGARSRGPKTLEGKARAAQNALRHGLRAEKRVVLPEEDADEFAGLEAAMIAELAPVGALQTVLARRGAVAAWRLARADRIEAELFAERRFADGAAYTLAVHQDVDEPPKWVAHIEAAHAPGFIGGAIFDRDLGLLHALQGGVEIIDFDREIGHRRARAAFGRDADLHAHLLG